MKDTEQLLVSSSKSALLVKARAQMNGPPSCLKIAEVHCIAWETMKAVPALANMEVQTLCALIR